MFFSFSQFAAFLFSKSKTDFPSDKSEGSRHLMLQKECLGFKSNHQGHLLPVSVPEQPTLLFTPVEPSRSEKNQKTDPYL